MELRLKAEQLEEELLSLDLLSSYSGLLVAAGDENTPPSRFVTLAEAYRCVALLQIYHIFPDILAQRFRLSLSSENDVPDLFYRLFQITFNSTSPTVRDGRHSLALHIVSLLDQLPTTSGTRCMQLVLLASIASDLVFSMGSLIGVAANALTSLNALDVEIAQARRWISTRLSELMQILPKLPIQRISDIVRETWERADSGLEVFWLDVMLERKLETIMG